MQFICHLGAKLNLFLIIFRRMELSMLLAKNVFLPYLLTWLLPLMTLSSIYSQNI